VICAHQNFGHQTHQYELNAQHETHGQRRAHNPDAFHCLSP
jgi:hypothetical protein